MVYRNNCKPTKKKQTKWSGGKINELRNFKKFKFKTIHI